MKKHPLLKKTMFVIAIISSILGLPFVIYHECTVEFQEKLPIPFSDSQMLIIPFVLAILVVGAIILHEKL